MKPSIIIARRRAGFNTGGCKSCGHPDLQFFKHPEYAAVLRCTRCGLLAHWMDEEALDHFGVDADTLPEFPKTSMTIILDPAFFGGSK